MQFNFISRCQIVKSTSAKFYRLCRCCPPCNGVLIFKCFAKKSYHIWFFYNNTYSTPHFFYFHIFIYTKYCTVHVGLCKCRIMGKLWKCPWQCVDKGYDGIEKCPLWCVDEDYDCSNVDVIDPCHTYVYVCRIIINTKFETPGMSVSNQWNVRSIGPEFIVSLINILHDVKCRRLKIRNIILTACLNPVKWMKDSENEHLMNTTFLEMYTPEKKVIGFFVSHLFLVICSSFHTWYIWGGQYQFC